MIVLKDVSGFEWDAGNRDKNWIKHRVSREECEEVFFDPHKRLLDAKQEFGDEKRYLLIGATAKGKLLFIVFVIRKNKVRIISARRLNKRESKFYEKRT